MALAPKIIKFWQKKNSKFAAQWLQNNCVTYFGVLYIKLRERGPALTYFTGGSRAYYSILSITTTLNAKFSFYENQTNAQASWPVLVSSWPISILSMMFPILLLWVLETSVGYQIEYVFSKNFKNHIKFFIRRTFICFY